MDISGLTTALADRYRVERPLGAGAMAIVYLAEDLRHQRKVALKVLRPELTAALGAQRFLEEIRVTAGLHHPHILPLFDSGEADSLLYYVMPYVEGESLRDRLDRKKQLAVDDAVRIATEVASALDHAHRRGVIHRDIKPENILLHDGHALVADFGIARAVSHAGGPRLTETGLIIGTPQYMSPEQAAADREMDARSDIYSLGAVVYEMLAGEPPHTGPSTRAVIARLMTEQPTPLSVLRPGMPAAVDRAVMKALARTPADRFATATEFVRAFAAQRLAGESAGARRRVIAGFAAAAALVVIAAALTVRRWAAREALDPDRIAVAVFENRTGDARLDPIGNMASDWVTRGIARIPQLHVLDVSAIYTQGRTASGEPTDARSLARRNGAALVVAGSYYKQADNLFFSTSIIDVARGPVLRVLDPIGAQASDPIEGIDELAQRVAAALAAIKERRAGPLTAAQPQPPRYAAYQEFVAAVDTYWRGRFVEAMPGFRRAIELDSLFLSARVGLALAAVGVSQCELVDSIEHSLRPRTDGMAELDRLTMAITRARCDVDWEEALRNNYRRAELQPGSSYVQWSIAANARRANRPAEAVAVLTPIDPARDLSWMSDEGKVFYWRELTAAQHMLGDYAAERRTAERSARMNPQRLSTLYHRARSLAGEGRAETAVRALDDVEALTADPVLVSGEIAGHMRPEHVGTPGWVLYQVATELLVHGNPDAAAIIGARAVRWFESRPAEEGRTPEHRITQALALEFVGRYDEAAAIVTGLAAEDTASQTYRGMLGVLAARRSDHATAQGVDEWLATRPSRKPPGEATLYRAQIAAVLGDVARALDLIEALPHRVHPTDFALLHSDPAFQVLLGEPRFQAYIRPRG